MHAQVRVQDQPAPRSRQGSQLGEEKASPTKVCAGSESTRPVGAPRTAHKRERNCLGTVATPGPEIKILWLKATGKRKASLTVRRCLSMSPIMEYASATCQRTQPA